MSETPIAGLADDLAKSRAAITPKPVTVADCQRTLTALRDHSNMVDRKTIIRQFELLLAQLAEQEERERIRLAAISCAAIGYWKEGDDIRPDYDTATLRDVARLYEKYAAK